MEERVLAMGLVKKPVSERGRLEGELARLTGRYDRAALYEQVWSCPTAGQLGTGAEWPYGEEATFAKSEVRRLVCSLPA